MIWAALKVAWAAASGFWRSLPAGVKKAILIFVAVVALVGYHFAALKIEHARGVSEGAQAERAKAQAELAAQKKAFDAKVAEIQSHQQEVITKTVVEYRDRIKVVKEKGDEIVKQVPVYVPMDSPLLSSGVRVLHDAAASGDVPDDPVRAIAAADPVETSTLLSTVAANYESCRADQERLAALQKLVSTLGETK